MSLPPKKPNRSKPARTASPRYFPSRRGSGFSAESKAATYLETQGLEILERNFACKMGEIDLVARDGRELVFVEVRMRREGFAWESAIESVGFGKLRRLELAIQFFLLRRERELAAWRVRSIRVDVVGFDGREFSWWKGIELSRNRG